MSWLERTVLGQKELVRRRPEERGEVRTRQRVLVLQDLAEVEDPEVRRRGRLLVLPFYSRPTTNQNHGKRVHPHHGCEGGGGDDSPLGQAFHTSSFTRPTVVSGSKDIVRRRPDTSRNVSGVCGVCGIAVGAAVTVTAVSVFAFAIGDSATSGTAGSFSLSIGPLV